MTLGRRGPPYVGLVGGLTVLPPAGGGGGGERGPPGAPAVGKGVASSTKVGKASRSPGRSVSEGAEATVVDVLVAMVVGSGSKVELIASTGGDDDGKNWPGWPVGLAVPEVEEEGTMGEEELPAVAPPVAPLPEPFHGVGPMM